MTAPAPELSTPLAVQLGQFAAAAYAGSVPSSVRDDVRRRMLDTVGICLAATALPTSRAIASFVDEQGGVEQATAIGLGRRVPAALAALCNGTLAHSLDFDDTHLPSVLHPSASVLPAALAAAEHVGADGDALLRAAAVGVEICVRIGMAGYDEATGNSVFFEHGQHATSICGAVGAGVSAALLYGGDAEAVTHSLGIAASMASGLLEANRTGGTVKRIHCGWAAHAGVSAARMAMLGITGPPTVLEGRFGFFQAWLRGQADLDVITDGLGERWLVPDIFIKPYPANHFTHAIADAVASMRRDGLKPSDVDLVTVGVAAPTVRTVGEPIDIKRTPETGYQAQFSAPYVVAAALFGGSALGLGLDDFTDELARDPGRRELMARVSVRADERCDAIYPHQFPAVVDVVTVDGRKLHAEVMANRGGPSWPLTTQEVRAKFVDNAQRAVPAETAERIAHAIDRLGPGLLAGDTMLPLLDGASFTPDVTQRGVEQT